MATAKHTIHSGESVSQYMVTERYGAVDKSWIQHADIPKYSIINSCNYSMTMKSGNNVSKGNLLIALSNHGISEGSPNGPTLGSWSGIIGTSQVTRTASLLSYVNSGNANAGKYNGSYAMIVWRMYHGVIRKYTLYDIHIIWDFTKPTYNISLKATEGGTAICTTNNSANYSTEVDVTDKTATIKATPQEGYKFVKWSDGNTNANRIITISHNSISATITNLSLTAEFEKESSGVNKIFVGNKQPSAIYIGTAQVKEIYVGNTLIYKK